LSFLLRFAECDFRHVKLPAHGAGLPGTDSDQQTSAIEINHGSGRKRIPQEQQDLVGDVLGQADTLAPSATSIWRASTGA